MKKYLSLIIALLLVTSLLFSSCGNKVNAGVENENEEKNEENVVDEEVKEDVTMSIIWWGGEARAEKTKKVIDMYMEKNPNVKIETEHLDWGVYWEKLGVLSASNELPDIMQQDYSKLTGFVEKGLLSDLNSFKEDNTIDASDINENAISSGNLGGKLIGMPLGMNSLVLAYDAEAFEKAGVDLLTNNMEWNDYYNAVVEVYNKTKIQSSIPYVIDPKLFIEYWVRSMGKSLYSQDGKTLGFDDPKILEDIFKEEQKMIQSGAFYSPAKEFSSDIHPLAEGKSFTATSWSNMIITMMEKAGKPLKLVTLPKINGSTQNATYLKPSMFFSVAESSENKKSAAEFINYFTNDVDANKVLMADRGIPIAGKVREALKVEVDENAKLTFDFIEEASKYTSPIDPPEPNGAVDVYELAKNINTDVLYMKITPEEAAKKFIEEANKILSAN